MSKQISELQSERATAFANVQRVLTATQTRRIQELYDMRLAALAACLEVNVPAAVIAEQSGLSYNRIKQLTKELGGKPDLYVRLIPE